jgi:hypothetical protein
VERRRRTANKARVKSQNEIRRRLWNIQMVIGSAKLTLISNRKFTSGVQVQQGVVICRMKFRKLGRKMRNVRFWRKTETFRKWME